MPKRSDKYRWMAEWQEEVEEGGSTSRYHAKGSHLRDFGKEGVNAGAKTRSGCVDLLKAKREGVESLPAKNPQMLLSQGIKENDMGKVCEAVGAGAKIDYFGPDNLSPLMEAVDRGNIEAVRVLVGLGADVNAKNEDGIVAIKFAIMNDNHSMVKELIRLDADVNIQNESGETPLIEALYCHSSYSILWMLLEKGADPFHKCEDTDISAVDLGKKDDRPEVRDLFRAIGMVDELSSDKSGKGADEYVKRGTFQNSAFIVPKKLEKLLN